MQRGRIRSRNSLPYAQVSDTLADMFTVRVKLSHCAVSAVFASERGEQLTAEHYGDAERSVVQVDGRMHAEDAEPPATS